MGHSAGSAVVEVISAVIGVAILAVLVGNTAQTAQVITSIGNALTSVLKAAEAPVTGSSGLTVATATVGN